jgi:hypothetical protein
MSGAEMSLPKLWYRTHKAREHKDFKGNILIKDFYYAERRDIGCIVLRIEVLPETRRKHDRPLIDGRDLGELFKTITRISPEENFDEEYSANELRNHLTHHRLLLENREIPNVARELFPEDENVLVVLPPTLPHMHYIELSVETLNALLYSRVDVIMV